MIEIRSMRRYAQASRRILPTLAHRHDLAAIDAPGKRGILSRWSASTSKRHFDLTCVLLSLPFTVPLLFLIAIAVRLTSCGPVLFRQRRMGRDGQTFTIYKFRTMRHGTTGSRGTISTLLNQPYTVIGPFLRHWKLDELPQLINVLTGDLSLVGPRPKVPRHQAHRLPCRPGITGRATLVFAREESALTRIPKPELDSYYGSVILPAKRRLDDEYMAEATFASDLRIILRSIFRHWDDAEASGVLTFRETEPLPTRA